MEPIYVIGDSHVKVLYEAEPNIFKSSQTDIANVFDSKTAYAAGSPGHEQYLNEALTNLPNGSIVLLSFGEIDCRHYVPKKAIENNTSIEQEVDVVLNRYKKNCLRLLVEKFRVIILGAYMCPEDEFQAEGNKYEDIYEAKAFLNLKLEIFCWINKLLFIPIFKKGLEEQWHKKGYPNYFKDSSHLGECMIPVILESMQGFKWDKYDF